MIKKSILKSACTLAMCLSVAACGKKFNPASGSAPSAQVIETSNTGQVTVDHPEQFTLVPAGGVDLRSKLNVTGTVNPDIAREVPVISLASGRVVDILTRLDDNVRKGQLLLKVQSPDITNAFDTYLKAVNDEHLAKTQLDRAEILYQHGAIPKSQLDQAQDTEQDAIADLHAAEGQLDTLGVNKNHPSNIVNVYAPISGVVVAQNVTNAAATGMNYAGSSTAFTIADLSTVWIICDVYENDIPKVRLGQQAFIHIDAYPGKVLIGHISDIGPVLDPNLRTAKVRIELQNPGILRLGMFVTATFESNTKKTYALIPADAILHLHDLDWVYIPAGGKKFQRVQVNTGDVLPGNKQEILSGIAPGQQVVSNVLQLEATLEAQ
ncbi:MAG: efflux RND transporter periplasmic adaptor subunit [Acidobacteriaceae bacterium]